LGRRTVGFYTDEQKQVRPITQGPKNIRPAYRSFDVAPNTFDANKRYSFRGKDGNWGGQAEVVTDRAVLIQLQNGKKIWLPKSACKIEAKGMVSFVDGWILQKKLESGELTKEDLKLFEE
jgi:hypothetical protein